VKICRDNNHIVFKVAGQSFSKVPDIYTYLQSGSNQNVAEISWLGKVTVLLVIEELRRFDHVSGNAVKKELDQYYLPLNNMSSAFQCGQDKALEALRTSLSNGKDIVAWLIQDLQENEE
jgi:hypothetical protein